MIEPTNDAELPFAVLVERLGVDAHGTSLSKGFKFYSGAPTREDAQELADVQNAQAGGRYQYTVTAEDHEVVQQVRARNRSGLNDAARARLDAQLRQRGRGGL